MTMPAGEAFDKAARAMGMPYPGGVHLDKVAEGGCDKAYTLPRPSVDGAPFDFSFSGLKTSVINLLHNTEQRGDEINIPDLAASYRKAVVDCLVKGTMKAVEATGAKTVVIAGGVSANRLLRRTLQAECDRRGLAFTGRNCVTAGITPPWWLLRGTMNTCTHPGGHGPECLRQHGRRYAGLTTGIKRNFKSW